MSPSWHAVLCPQLDHESGQRRVGKGVVMFALSILRRPREKVGEMPSPAGWIVTLAVATHRRPSKNALYPFYASRGQRGAPQTAGAEWIIGSWGTFKLPTEQPRALAA